MLARCCAVSEGAKPMDGRARLASNRNRSVEGQKSAGPRADASRLLLPPREVEAWEVEAWEVEAWEAEAWEAEAWSGGANAGEEALDFPLEGGGVPVHGGGG